MPRRLFGLVVLVVALVAAGCGAGGDEGTSGQAGADLGGGKQLFSERCGSCHVLADAGTPGQVGPNLDHAFGFARQQGFDDSTFFEVVLRQIDIPAQGGGMPADLVQGQEAVDVAAYVASVAGTDEESLEAAGAPAGGGGETGAGGATDGRSIFTANCGSCHTLADAGTSGEVGPNLDESQPPRDLVIDRVTNGRGAMPAFEGILSDDQIQAVADYVSSSAGG